MSSISVITPAMVFQLSINIIRYVPLPYSCRMGLDQQLGPGFNPMSTSRGDVQLFRESVASFQREAGLGGVCQRGALCSNTIDTIRQALRTKRDTF